MKPSTFGLTPLKENLVPWLKVLWRWPEQHETQRVEFPWPAALCLMATAFALRLGYLFDYGVLLFPDAVYRYLPVGTHVPEVWLGSLYDTPGYPLLIALVHHTVGVMPGLLVVQNLLSTLTVGLSLDLGLRLGLGRWAWLPALALTLGPSQVAFANIPLSEVLFLFFTTAWACLLVRWHRDRGTVYFLLLALVTACLILTRANGLLFLAVAAGLALWSAILWRRAMVFAVAAAAVVLPVGAWIGFNGAHHGFYGIAQGSGWQFLQAVAYHDLLDPQTLPAPFNENYRGQATLYEMRAQHFQPGVARAGLVPYDALYGSLARRNVAAQPAAYLGAVWDSALLPMRETRDMARAVYHQGYWEHQYRVTASSKWHTWMKPYQALPRRSFFDGLQPFSLSWAYPLLLLISALVCVNRILRQDLFFAILCAIPVGQHLLLSFLLNPIDRYFFPMEPLLLVAGVCALRGCAPVWAKLQAPRWLFRFGTHKKRAAETVFTQPEAVPVAKSGAKKLVIVPAYNEAPNLINLVTRLSQLRGWDYVIINDGSSDDSAYVLEQLQVPHLNLPVNLGIGGAMQTGYRYALLKGYDYAIQIDGDGQHDPLQINDLYAHHHLGDCIIGSRFILREGYQSSFARLIGIRMISAVLQWTGGKRIHDPTSGMRLVNRRVIRLFAEYYPHDFPEPESAAMLLRAGLRVAEVPVQMRARGEGESSIRGLKSLAYMVQVLPKIVLSSWFQRYV
ncbi:glycosyltransferase [Acanthopleuribacter pedis]|uniref:Glycosyltransferase family 2 protein n=1 Tax=Acanthopleuribacter pedis TaxID=442870 RepID=A0A8J7Q4A0_9BACT|nr:glycosyltransferase [Acanthopleuribacter pedis]MBO1317787.1 glycosyltransferase family 2 protein [Acanthopleuribacter pedis]